MKNRDPKSQKSKTSSDDVKIGNNVSDSIIIHGDGNAINVDINKLIKPLTAPPLPPIIIGRDKEIKELKERLGVGGIEGKKEAVQIITSIRGWAGVGKSTLASAIAHDVDVLKKYSDGVLWASLGPNPNITSILTMWDRALGGGATEKDSTNRTLEELSLYLTSLLRSKKVLFVLDDVWNFEDVKSLQIGGANSALLITTRSNAVATALTEPSNIYRLPVLNEEDSLMLLNNFAANVVRQQPELCRKLVSEVEGLPLALYLLAHMLQQGVNPETLLEELRRRAELLWNYSPSDKDDLSNEPAPAIHALIAESVDRLNDLTKTCFAYLGVFAPKPATFDLNAMTYVWQVDKPELIVRELVDIGLLEFIPEMSRYQLHALLVSYAESMLGGE